MKRLMTIVLAIAVLFMTVSCDDFTPLSQFLDKMNDNVLGTSTENADIAKDKVDNTINKKEEVKVPVAPKVDVDTESLNAGDTVKVPVTEDQKAEIENSSTKVGGMIVTEETQKAAQQKAADLAAQNGGEPIDVTNVLEPIKEDEKKDLLETIAATKDNKQTKEKFDKEMAAPAPVETQKATKGTVAVVSSTIDTIINMAEAEQKPGEPAAPVLDEKVKGALKEAQTALDGFIAPVDKDGNPAELTKADATIVKLAESFLTKTVTTATETTYEVHVTKNADNTTTETVVPVVKAKEITEEDKKALASEAAELVTVLNTMSASSRIDTQALSDLISSLAGSATGGKAPAARGISRDTDATLDTVELVSFEVGADDIENITQTMNLVTNIHKVLQNVFTGDQSSQSILVHFRLLRVGYESFVNNSSVEAIAKDSNFSTIDSFIKYAVTAAMVEADSIKAELTSPARVDLLNNLGIDASVIGRLSVYDLVHEIIEASPMFDSTKNTFTVNIPKKYLTGDSLNAGTDNANVDALVDALQEILKDPAVCSVRSMFDVVEKVASPVLGESMAVQIKKGIDSARDFLDGKEVK